MYGAVSWVITSQIVSRTIFICNIRKLTVQLNDGKWQLQVMEICCSWTYRTIYISSLTSINLLNSNDVHVTTFFPSGTCLPVCTTWCNLIIKIIKVNENHQSSSIKTMWSSTSETRSFKCIRLFPINNFLTAVFFLGRSAV